MRPLIVTLSIDEAAHACLTALRTKHFPPERNFLDAHITLFHALPGERIDEISDTLRAAADAQPPFPLTVTAPYSLGRGVALRVDAPPLIAMRARLAENCVAHLTPQDAQGYRPHITLQNKVAPEAARALLSALLARWQPLAATAHGLSLWHYAGGPWQPAQNFVFAGAA